MAAFELIINGINVLPRTDGRPLVGSAIPASLVSFERNYDDPSRLVIQFNRDWRSPPFPADTPVSLTRDGVVVFEGLLDLPRPIASVGEYPIVEYSAFDRSRLLRFPSAVDDQGKPIIGLQAGPLVNLVNQFLGFVSATLTEKGVDPTVAYLNGADLIESFPVSLENESIDTGFRRIAAAAPGVRIFLKPGDEGDPPRYTFVNIFGSPAHDLVIDREFVPSLSIQQSIDGRAGAIKTLSRSTVGSADVVLDRSELLIPAWDPNDEAKWRFSDAFSIDEDGNPPPLADVYRLFSFAAFADDITEEIPLVANVEVIPDEVPANSRWQKVGVGSVDYQNKTLRTNQPALKGFEAHKAGTLNLYEPGRAKPTQTRLLFSQSGTAVTTIFIEGARFPVTGFSGRAVELAPVTCAYEKIVDVPGGVNPVKFAADAHRALSEPIVSGSVPLNQEPPDELWFLDRRINLRTDEHGLSGHEGLNAPMLGVDVSFDNGITSNVRFNRDDSELLGEGER